MSSRSETERDKGPAPSNLEHAAAAYDRAIRKYQNRYRQEQSRQGLPAYAPFSNNRMNEYSNALAAYEEGLRTVAQALRDFRLYVRSLPALGKKEREDYGRWWKEYLRSLLDFSRQLEKSLEESARRL